MRRLVPWSVLVLASTMLVVPAATGSDYAQDGETPPIEQATDNMSLVAHDFFPEGTDMMFQRREGRQNLDGVLIDESRDYVFIGADSESSQDDGAVFVYDVTDPTAPQRLVEIPCQGYHADIAVYENMLIHAFDSGASNGGCDPEQAATFDPLGLDRVDVEGIRVYDITDPARPFLMAFLGEEEGIGSFGSHNITVVPWAGLLYLAQAGFSPTDNFTLVDLNDDALLEVTQIPMQEITPGSADLCHDIGLDPVNELAFCAAIGSTHIWDISDPYLPVQVSTIANPKISIHHGARLAPDGVTLVLNDEHAGALDEDLPIPEGAGPFPGDAGIGANGCLADPTVGALWFYDVTDPTAPQLPVGGSFAPSTPQPLASPCTSHFYNFIPGTTLVVSGWYEGGIIVADYATTPPTEHAVFLPELGSFWAAYYWHGYIYGSSRTDRAKGFGGGLWVVALDGVGDVEPAAADEGTSWIRWTSEVPLEQGGDGVTIRRVAGGDRIETAVAASSEVLDDAPVVVVARADTYADALAGGPLAAALGGPVLLTSPFELDPRVAAEIARLDARHAVILGGPGAVRPDVVTALEDLGLSTERLDGANRYETAAEIARRLDGLDPAPLTRAVVVQGEDVDPSRGWPDAVSAAPYAAQTGQPILLTRTGDLPAMTADVLGELGVTRTTVVGGPVAVSEAVVDALVEGGFGPARIAGSSRYATSAAVYDLAVAEGASAREVWVATGRDWPDALTAGPVVAAAGDSFLLIDGQDLSGSPQTHDILRRGDADVIRVLGGRAVVTDAVLGALR